MTRRSLAQTAQLAHCGPGAWFWLPGPGPVKLTFLSMSPWQHGSARENGAGISGLGPPARQGGPEGTTRIPSWQPEGRRDFKLAASACDSESTCGGPLGSGCIAAVARGSGKWRLGEPGTGLGSKLKPHWTRDWSGTLEALAACQRALRLVPRPTAAAGCAVTAARRRWRAWHSRRRRAGTSRLRPQRACCEPESRQNLPRLPVAPPGVSFRLE